MPASGIGKLGIQRRSEVFDVISQMKHGP